MFEIECEQEFAHLEFADLLLVRIQREINHRIDELFSISVSCLHRD